MLLEGEEEKKDDDGYFCHSLLSNYYVESQPEFKATTLRLPKGNSETERRLQGSRSSPQPCEPGLLYHLLLKVRSSQRPGQQVSVIFSGLYKEPLHFPDATLKHRPSHFAASWA